MKSRWIMVLVTALALGAPRLPLASQVSYEDRHPQESQQQGSTQTGEKTGMPGMHGMARMSSMGEMQGMQDRGVGAKRNGKHTMSCSCPCRGPRASSGPSRS